MQAIKKRVRVHCRNTTAVAAPSHRLMVFGVQQLCRNPPAVCLQNSRFHHDLLPTFFLSLSLKPETSEGSAKLIVRLQPPQIGTRYGRSVQTHRELEHMLSGCHKAVTCQESLNGQLPSIFHVPIASIRLVNIISHPPLFQVCFYF